MSSVAPLLIRATRYGAVSAVLVAVIAGVVGTLVAGVPGLIAGLGGALLAGVFLGLTALSILLAGRLAHGDLTDPRFAGVLLGSLLVKLLVFFVVTLPLRGQSWLDPAVFGYAVIGAVVGSLAADVIAFVRSRVPLDVRLPGESDHQPSEPRDPGSRRDGD